MKKLLFATLIAVSFAAQAQNIEVGIGAAQYTDRGDGVWYQDAFQHKLKLTVPVAEIAVTGDISESLGYRAGWAWIGQANTQGMAVGDSNYNLQSKSCNGACWPLANFVGGGHDQGFFVTAERKLIFGDVRPSIEFGPYIHKSIWTENVYNWIPNATAVPQNLTINNIQKWQIGALTGASVKMDNLTIRYQYFFNKNTGDLHPAIWSGAHVITANYEF